MIVYAFDGLIVPSYSLMVTDDILVLKVKCSVAFVHSDWLVSLSYVVLLRVAVALS